ncbi:MAG: extensin family protein [Paracoccaceae bacterium]
MIGRLMAGAGCVLIMAAGAAVADAPSTSPRPISRPEASISAPVVAVPTPLPMSIRPKSRPALLAVVPASPASPPEVVVAMSSAVGAPAKAGLFGFLRPAKRPEGFGAQKLTTVAVARVMPGKQGVVSKKGAVCGDPRIMGEALAPITSKVQGCGVAEPVKVTSVAGVRLSQPATIDCDTARALTTWVERGLEPAYGKGKIVELQVAGHYVCRTRNNRSGAKVSEHGRGRAIDISAFTFSNGKTVTVVKNFDKTMRKAHRAACGVFGTTLGPGSDGMHEDHLHFDTAKHRNGSYCR